MEERKAFKIAVFGGYRKGDVETYIGQLEGENNTFRVQREKLKEELQGQREYAVSLQIGAEALQRELEEQRAKVKETEEELRAIRKKAEDAEALTKEMRTELESARAERESLREELEGKRTEREALQEELERMRAEQEALQAEEKALRQDAKAIKDELKKQCQEREMAQKERAEQEKLILRLHRELEWKKRQAEEQKKAYEKKLGHIRRMGIQGTAIRESSSGVKAGFSSLVSKLFSVVPSGLQADDRTKQVPLVTFGVSQKKIGERKTEVTLIGSTNGEDGGQKPAMLELDAGQDEKMTETRQSEEMLEKVQAETSLERGRSEETAEAERPEETLEAKLVEAASKEQPKNQSEEQSEIQGGLVYEMETEEGAYRERIKQIFESISKSQEKIADMLAELEKGAGEETEELR